MQNVRRIVILYPGATSWERVSKPANYSLSRLLIHLRQRGDVPICLLNQSAHHEQDGNVEFIHFTNRNFLNLLVRSARKRGTLIISQNGAYHRHAKLLRAAMPGSRILVRLGGVYFGRQYLESAAFEPIRRVHRRRLAAADMIISTADGTPVDLYMSKVGVERNRYEKWLNGLPLIANDEKHERANRIVCISRLHQEKAIDYVVRSFAAALPRLPEPCTLRIVGDGPDLENLRSLCRELRITEWVEFVGHADDVGPHLYSSKLLVTGLANNSILEAIATGTPVVTVDLGEMRTLYGDFPNVHVIDYLPGGYGRIPADYLPGLVKSTSDAIVGIITARPSPNGQVSGAIFESHGWDRRLRMELELYERLLA